jgi:steroid delta-isomerase-like uncharacterized protein
MNDSELLKPVRALYERLNEGDIDGIVANVSDDFEFIDVPSLQTIRGKKGFADYMQAWKTAFPDGKGQLKNMFVSGDSVVIEAIGTGTHGGEFAIAGLLVPATGKKVEFHFCQIYQVADGKIVKGRSYYDTRPVLVAAVAARAA